MVTFAHPAALLLLALPPLAALWRHVRRRPGLGVPDATPALAAASRPGWALLVPACRYGGLTLLALALAGPGLRRETARLTGRGIDIVLAIDISESMAAMDFRLDDRTVTRLEAVTGAARKFAAARPGDRIGLIAFGSRAYTVIPPTADREALFAALSRLETGIAGKRTAVGDALGLAVRRLRQAPGLSRVAVLFGDGRSNAGELRPETAAQAAADHGVRIHAVGVGGDAPAPFLVNHPLLGRQIVHEKAPPDEAALARIAGATGGIAFRAGDAPGLARALAALGAMEKSDMAEDTTTGETPLAPGLAALAVCALTLQAALAQTRFVRLP